MEAVWLEKRNLRLRDKCRRAWEDDGVRKELHITESARVPAFADKKRIAVCNPHSFASFASFAEWRDSLRVALRLPPWKARLSTVYHINQSLGRHQITDELLGSAKQRPEQMDGNADNSNEPKCFARP